MTLSTHKVEVVRVYPQPHDGADNLEVVNVFGGYPCCVQKGTFQQGELAAYVPPDSLVDTSRPEFAFLAKDGETHHRVKCIKLRGVLSYGILLHIPESRPFDVDEGCDLAEFFGVTHYEPPMDYVAGHESIPAPHKLAGLSKFDVDSLRRYPDMFQDGETVYVSEKIHGASSRYCYWEHRMWCGSRTEWKAQNDRNLFWQALTHEMEQFCVDHPGMVLYGEVYGLVSGYRYGVNAPTFVAFDVYSHNAYFSASELHETIEMGYYDIPCVPLVEIMPYDFQQVCQLAEGPSLMPGAKHNREGVVVRPAVEKFDPRVGRVIGKVVGSGFLRKDK